MSCLGVVCFTLLNLSFSLSIFNKTFSITELLLFEFFPSYFNRDVNKNGIKKIIFFSVVLVFAVWLEMLA